MADLFSGDDENKAIFMTQFYATRMREAFEAMSTQQLTECLDDLIIWPMWLFTRFPSDVIDIFEKLSQFEVDEGTSKEEAAIQKQSLELHQRLIEYRKNPPPEDALRFQKKEADRKERENKVACDGCGKHETKIAEFSLCGGCRKASYCSRDCQKKRWPVHKLACGKNAK